MLKCYQPYVRDYNVSDRSWFYSRKARLRKTPFPCGRCEACQMKRKLEWANRLLLESEAYPGCVIHVTLTYNDDCLPADGNLSKKDFINFMKRLRINISRKIDKNLKIKYFCRGEYGPKRLRPHFHVIIFGLDRSHEQVIMDSWDQGFIKLELIQKGTCNYVAGYTSKKLEAKLPAHIETREYQSQSGGIGAKFAEALAKRLAEDKHYKGKPITYIQKGKKKIGVGRYIRNAVGKNLKKYGKKYNDLEVLALEFIYCQYFRRFKTYKEMLKDCKEKARIFTTPKFRVRI